ncbi:MAG: 50S ribosomal protein L35 [Parcubacteria group bacterium Licking1014_17]|nr:MAG: 50S ribosomal protein L35 [Parcubacteria group bacterium Licking1014_17]
MPKMKLKTSKSALKRFRFTATGKVSRRKTRLNHFNAKDTGSTRRNRRKTKNITVSQKKDIKNLMPYENVLDR